MADSSPCRCELPLWLRSLRVGQPQAFRRATARDARKETLVFGKPQSSSSEEYAPSPRPAVTGLGAGEDGDAVLAFASAAGAELGLPAGASLDSLGGD